jgi:predicted component of type VI protein secretion system
MQQKIAEILNQYEPRIILTGVKVRADDNRNAYNCTISFLIVGSQEPVEVDTFLERLR